MEKAEQACASARSLLDLGDIDGSSNRAYYAMFNAARAALLASNAPVKPEISKTHRGLIGAFGLHLVKNGPVSKELGRLLNRAEEIREIADYANVSVEITDAITMVEQAEEFVKAIRATFMPASHQLAHDDEAVCSKCHSAPCICEDGDGGGGGASGGPKF